MTLEEMRLLCEVARWGPWRDAHSTTARKLIPKLVALAVLVKEERRVITEAEAGLTSGFGVADAIEAVDAAMDALEEL